MRICMRVGVCERMRKSLTTLRTRLLMRAINLISRYSHNSDKLLYDVYGRDRPAPHKSDSKFCNCETFRLFKYQSTVP